MELGILTLLPVAVLFTLIFVTKRMLFALTCATLIGSILIGKAGFAKTWLDTVQGAFMGGTLGYLILLLALFGILIALLDKSNAVTQFAAWLTKYANTKRKTLLITYVLGWLIFLDDYLNNMAISTAMKRVSDSYGIPRTQLGYMINSLAAPVCIVIPISTWAVFYSGMFEDYGVTVGGSGMGAYIAALPYMFFAWITGIIVLLMALGFFPMIGVIKKHSQIAQETGIVCTKEASMDGVEIAAPEFSEILPEGIKPTPWNFLLPIAVLVAVTILADINVLIGCMAGIVTIGLIILIQRKLKFYDLLEATFSGVTSMVGVSALITLAVTMVEINTKTGMSDFIVDTVSPYLNGAFLPAMVFGFCAVYSYFGGGFWDMSLIFVPIVVPLANQLGVDPLLPCAALVCASAAGSTTYVCGDAVMITSRAVDIKPYYQMLATLPYALIAYGLTIVCYVVVGFVQ